MLSSFIVKTSLFYQKTDAFETTNDSDFGFRSNGIIWYTIAQLTGVLPDAESGC